ncbi:pseudouridine synthase [Alishewanella sp. WH16-1]|uniref:bifunctional tRNA pseudouridine(32) synthase/23S rRNA pseudouridine(746) synthase RluA n=1 Tax=Alishewanella sp. WH16-1 TaxID=1651088 RepID=UPI000710F391|nr:bifunctional tRNA pseudouridine(32) synthase/23S rRNA pseudouridine(746) synthase RluA [Alishewanella sp. WH16-1]KRS20058.1 pseudouridine synthase [Alishewanella sp. WH16-1]
MLLEYQPPLWPYLDILYQDEQLVVLNKPSGLLSVPGKAPEHFDSLQYRVQRVWPQATVVHRLDMATSGVMVMALTKAAQRELNRQFQQRLTAKRYIALVQGQPQANIGSIELPLICDWPNRPKQKVCFEHGKPSLTHFRVLQRYSEYSRLELEPVTGRSHQLRVHMQAIGHPILGDKFYATTNTPTAPRLQLHAAELMLWHPVSGARLQFAAVCPF